MNDDKDKGKEKEGDDDDAEARWCAASWGCSVEQAACMIATMKRAREDDERESVMAVVRLEDSIAEAERVREKERRKLWHVSPCQHRSG